MALHSAKDLPDDLREGLSLAAITPLEGPREDVLVLHPRWASASSVEELPAGLRIGTSSARRREQLSHLRSDWELVDIRGTIEERLARVSSGEIDGVVMAALALTRLALEVPHLPSPLSPTPCRADLRQWCGRVMRRRTASVTSSTIGGDGAGWRSWVQGPALQTSSP